MKSTAPRGVSAIAAAVLGACLLVHSMAQAQSRPYPEKPVRVVVPAPSGSAPDFLVRLLGQKLSESWNQPLVIDNVVGASGNIGTDRWPRPRPTATPCCSTPLGRSPST